MARFTGNAGVVPSIAAPFNSGSLQTGLSDRVTGIVFSDTAGSLFVEQSVDGNNWDLSKSIAVTGNTGLGFSEELIGPFYRIRYVPTSDGAVFRLAARTSSAGSR